MINIGSLSEEYKACQNYLCNSSLFIAVQLSVSIQQKNYLYDEHAALPRYLIINSLLRPSEQTFTTRYSLKHLKWFTNELLPKKSMTLF